MFWTGETLVFSRLNFGNSAGVLLGLLKKNLSCLKAPPPPGGGGGGKEKKICLRLETGH